MSALVSPRGWWAALKRQWLLYHLADPAYAFLFDPPPPGDWVALDVAPTVTGAPRDVALVKHPFIEHFFQGERGRRAMTPVQGGPAAEES